MVQKSTFAHRKVLNSARESVFQPWLLVRLHFTPCWFVQRCAPSPLSLPNGFCNASFATTALCCTTDRLVWQRQTQARASGTALALEIPLRSIYS
jgi:hypothetical protein